MTRFFVQWSVVLGVWWALLIDVIGNWAGQDHTANWVALMQYTIAVIVLVLAAMKVRLLVGLR
jgi:hypothetical protein